MSLPALTNNEQGQNDRSLSHVSQCSTLVRNTVVRASLQAYGKWWISTPWGAETGEPIEMKLGMGDYVGDPTTPQAQNEKCT